MSLARREPDCPDPFSLSTSHAYHVHVGDGPSSRTRSNTNFNVEMERVATKRKSDADGLRVLNAARTKEAHALVDEYNSQIQKKPRLMSCKMASKELIKDFQPSTSRRNEFFTSLISRTSPCRFADVFSHDNEEELDLDSDFAPLATGIMPFDHSIVISDIGDVSGLISKR